MPIVYKTDVMKLLKEAGYSSTRLRREKLLGETYMKQLRNGEMVSWKALDTICRVLDCKPGDLLDRVEDKETETAVNNPLVEVCSYLEAIGCKDERTDNSSSIHKISKSGRVLWIKRREGQLYQKGDEEMPWSLTNADSIIDYFK